MYRTLNDFNTDWKFEVDSTLKIFDVISEEKKAHRLSDDVRSLERLAWHLTQTLTELPHKAGLLDSDMLEGAPIPVTFQGIIDNYKKYSEVILAELQQKWTDQSLLEVVNMYGEDWTKGTVLSVLVRHQIHHRGQMTTIMRLVGLKVPGIYGPAKEEWAEFGMPAMD